MAEQKLSSLQQAYAEKNRVLKNNEGATESRRAALSAVSGRSILKTKEETEKMRRNEEIAVRVSAANIEGAAASGAVTMEKAKASAAAQLDKTKRNEVLSILKMGIYDPSFPSILGFREDVVKNFADKKAREIEERKAIKKASENARQEYEQALAEIQNIKKVAGTYNGDEVHIETPKNTEEARKALDIAAKRATDPSISVNTVSLITQQVMDPIRDAIWSGEGRSDGRSAARAAATKTEPISAAKQKALQEEKLKQAEQRAAAMKAAKDRYEEILAKRIKKKQALNQELTGLEKQTVESPAGRIRLARQELEHATANEREEAFSNYTDQVTGGIQEAALAASAAIEQIAVKTERAEELNDAEKETLNAQRDQLQQMIRALERELKETDLSIEGQDFLVEQKENLNLLLESVETGINYAAHYEENKEQLLYQYYDGLYGSLSLKELEAELAERRKQKESSARSSMKTKSAAELYLEAKEAESEIEKIEEYIRLRKEREANQPKIENGQKLIMEAPGSSYFEKFQYMMDVTGESIKKYGYYTGEDIEDPNNVKEVLEKSYAESTVWAGSQNDRRDITLAYHANLKEYAEDLFTPEELERFSADMASKIRRDMSTETGKGTVIQQLDQYSGGRDETFKGKYGSYYDDILSFTSGNYGNFTEEEGKRVLAIMDRYGYDAAFDYYAAAKEDALLRRAGQLHTAARVTLGILSGAEQFLTNGGAMLSNALNSEGGYARIGGDLFTASHQLNMMGIENDALEGLYMIGYSVVDMIPTVALSSIPYVGQAAGTTYMFSKVLAQTYNDTIAQGKRADEALTYAVLNAAAETTMEKMLGGIESLASKSSLLKKMHGAVQRLSATPGMKRALRFLSSMGSEGMEEFLQEVADPFFRKLASDLTTMEESELDAIDWDEAVKSFIIGAGSAGILNGITGISNARNSGVKYTAAYESLINGNATNDIAAGAELGNKRAKEVLRAIQTQTPRYAGAEGLFAFASPQDMINIRQSIKRRGNRQVMEMVKNSLNSIEGAKKTHKKSLMRIFEKILNGKSIDVREAAEIINDQTATAIFEQIAGTKITGKLPNEVAALARLEAFVDERGKISKGRINLFQDTFGRLDTKAINEIMRYRDMARTADVIFEDAAVKEGLDEEAQDAVAALRILTEETQIAFLVTDQYRTGDYLAGNVVAIRPEDLNHGVFYSAAHRAYFITQQIDPEAAAAIKEFILHEAERIMTKEDLAAEIKKIRRQLAVDGEDISEETAKDELCARLLPSILLQGVNIEKLTAENEAAAVQLRRALAAVREHLTDAIEQKRIDQGLKNFAESVLAMKDKNAVQKRQYKIGNIDKQHADLLTKIIEGETGKKYDFSNYEVWINGNTIRHIEKRHGENGLADHSMSRTEDIAMIPWILNYATDGEILRKKNGKPDLDYEHRNADHSPSPKVLLRRLISDETFFIAECVPDNTAKRIYIKSAYKNKNGSSTAQLLSMEPSGSLQPTSETFVGYSTTANNSISDSAGNVNRNIESEPGNTVIYNKKENEPQVRPRTAYVPATINDSFSGSNGTARALLMEPADSPQFTSETLNGYLPAANNNISDSAGNVNRAFYETVFNSLTEDANHVYKRLTQAIKESRAEKQGFRNGDITTKESIDLDAEVELPGDITDDMPEKAKNYIRRMEWDAAAEIADGFELQKKDRHKLTKTLRLLAEEFITTGKIAEETTAEVRDQLLKENKNETDGAERTVKDALQKLTEGLKTAERYAKDRRNKAKENAEAPVTLQEAADAYRLMKYARRDSERAKRENLLTENDEIQVGRLLKGEIKLEHLSAERDNIAGITAVYEAELEYEQIAKSIKRYNRQRKEDLRAKADEFLKTANEWQDKNSTFLYSRETMERNIYGIIENDPDLAQRIIDFYFTPVHEGAAATARMQNQYRERVRKLALSRKVKKGDKISESAAVQMLGEALDHIRILEQSRKKEAISEGKTLEEWKTVISDIWAENKSLNQEKIQAAVEEFRDIYNELFQLINEVRIRNGYEPINYRSGYFPHFQQYKMEGFYALLGKALGIEMEVTALPTTINGLTENFKPGIRWFENAQQRKGFETTYDAVLGFDKYIAVASDIIYQTDNIQKLRALASQIRYRTSEEGIRKQIDEIDADGTLTEEDAESRKKKIYEEGRCTLANFVVELDEYINLLANKKSRADRNTESLIGRRFYNISKAIERRFGANIIVPNIGSWLTNLIPLQQGGAELGPEYLLKGMWEKLKSLKQSDGFIERSTFLTNRRGSDPIVQAWEQKAAATIGKPMEWIDYFTADSLTRGRYMQNLSKGLSEENAIKEADAWVAGVMADRSKGAMPTLFSRMDPITKAFTQFMLEVNNQFSYLFKDIPRHQREKGKAALAAVLFQFFIGAFLLNELFEFLIGRRPALDPFGILNDTVGDFTGYEVPNLIEFATGKDRSFETEKKDAADALMALGTNIAEELPFIGGLLGGGRIPIASALPDFEQLFKAILPGEWSGKKRAATIGKELLGKTAAYILPPFGGGQLKKIIQGTIALAKGGSYTTNAEGEDILQYPVFKDNILDAINIFLFGKTSTRAAREWVEGGFKNFSVAETAAFQGMIEAEVSAKDAYQLLLDMKDLNEQLRSQEESEPKKDAGYLRRKLLRESGISKEGQSVYYCAVMASESELELIEQLAETDADIGEVCEALMKIKDADSLASGSYASNRKRDAIAQTNLSDEAKIEIYRATISKTRNEEIQSFSDAGLDFNSFLKAQNEYSSIGEKYKKAAEKATAFSSWIEQQPYTEEQKEAIRENFKYYSQIPVEATTYNKLTDSGISDEISRNIADKLSGLEPEAGEEKITIVQKYRAIAEADIPDADKRKAIEAIAADTDIKRLQIVYKYHISLDQFIAVKENLAKLDKEATGTSGISGAKVEASINKVNGLSIEQCGALWQAFVSSKSAKNNPYSVEVGQEVLNAVKNNYE